MSEIVEFLKARLDEDEARAQHALNADLDHLPTVECRCGRRLHLGGDADRALREVEAKRRIIAMHHLAELECPQSEGDYRCCEEYTCQCQIDALDLRDAVEVRDQHAEWPCPTVRALAAVYADHPEYDPEWR